MSLIYSLKSLNVHENRLQLVVLVERVINVLESKKVLRSHVHAGKEIGL
jgi:hypothetical protein